MPWLIIVELCRAVDIDGGEKRPRENLLNNETDVFNSELNRSIGNNEESPMKVDPREKR